MILNKYKTFDEYIVAIRNLSQNILIPSESKLTHKNGIPEDLTEILRKSGLFGISIPRKYDGLELSMEEQILLTFEFCQASCVYRSRFSTTIGLTSQVILDFGSKNQKENYLPLMAKGLCTGAFALTETDAGSDAGSLKTKAVKQNNSEWVINGEKRYITNAPQADVFLVMARSNPETIGSDGISAFLVDAKNNGVKVSDPPKMLGNEGSHVCYVWYNDCRVPSSSLLGNREGNGLKLALRGINHARLHVAATCVGQSIRLIKEMTKYSSERKQFNKSIGNFGQISAMLADSRSEMLAGQALCLDCAKKFDNEKNIPFTDIASAKLFCSEMVSRIADRALQIMGGMGYMEDYSDVPRLYRDVRLFRIFEGSSQIQQNTISKFMMKNYLTSK